MAARRVAVSMPRMRSLFGVAAAIMIGGIALMIWTLADERRATWDHAVETSQNVDVVLMDSQMPRLDGLEATRQIRAMAPPKGTVPIIALTANAMVGASAQFFDAGMNDYPTKPFDAKQLHAKLAAGAAARSGKPLDDARAQRTRRQA